MFDVWYDSTTEKDKFDLILVLHVIYLIPDREALLAKCRNLLTQNGIVIIGFCSSKPNDTLTLLSKPCFFIQCEKNFTSLKYCVCTLVFPFLVLNSPFIVLFSGLYIIVLEMFMF